MDPWLKRLAVFVLVLIALKFFFRWPISIIGSVVISIVVSLGFALFERR